MTKTGHILKIILFCSTILYTRLVYGQPGDGRIYIGIDVSSVDTSSLAVVAYQAKYDTLYQKVSKGHYQEYPFSNKRTWTYSKKIKTPTISFQKPINTVILTSDTNKMEIFFRSIPYNVNLATYPLIFQPGVFVCDDIPKTNKNDRYYYKKKHFKQIKDSTLNQVIVGYYLSHYKSLQNEKEKQMRWQEEAKKRKQNSKPIKQNSKVKIYPRTDTTDNVVYYYKTEQHIIRTIYRTKELKVKVAEYEYISYPNQPTRMQKRLSVSGYYDSGQIRSKRVDKKKWAKSIRWYENGKIKYKGKSKASSKKPFIIVWTFKENGKITLRRSKRDIMKPPID